VGRMASFVDITKRKRAEERIGHLSAVLRAIRSVNQLIIRERDRDRLLQGACDRLIETCGYDNAWIALMDETGVLVTATGAGSDKEFLPILERLKRGELPDCAQQALSQSEVVVTDGLSLPRADRPLAVNYGGGGVMTVRLEYGEKVYGLLSLSVSADFATIEEEHALFREVAGDIAFALYSIELEEKRKRAEEELRRTLERLREALGGIIQTVALTVETKDPYTAGHQRRVGNLARAIADEMGLPEEQIDGIRMAGLIHDLGKVAIPTEILSKPGRLSDFEWGMIKMHSQIGYDILKKIDFSWPVAQIVLQHHERMNGSGYPQGLSGEEIILEARILAVADVVEAMASHRPYRPALGIDKALEEISQNRGVLYDPEVVDACLRLFTENGFRFE